MSQMLVNLKPAERWASGIGGLVLAMTILKGEQKWKLPRAMFAAELMRRGASGRCYLYEAVGHHLRRDDSTSIPYKLGIHVKQAMTIAKPRAEVFAFWKDFSKLASVMRHLVSVERRNGTSHWIAEGPGGRRFEWDAEIVDEVENGHIGWRSIGEPDVDTAGSVHFKDAPGGRGTEVIVKLQYNPPGGYVTAYAAKLFGRDAESQIIEDLHRLKQQMETGEVATAEGQPSGPRYPNRSRGDNDRTLGASPTGSSPTTEGART